MAFTHALYYPWIDIEDSGWLKTAMLYWDKISTIVPENITKPYEADDSASLYQAGILQPLNVRPWDEAVYDASRDFTEYLDSVEAASVLQREWEQQPKHFLKPVNEVSKLNKLKMDEGLVQRLIESGRVIEAGDWLVLDREMIEYYMTLLAANLSKEKHLALLTKDEVFEQLSNKVKRRDNPGIRKQRLGEALLAQVVLETVKIEPDTPIEKIIGFRKNYADEIGVFRTEIGKLAQGIDPETPSVEALQQQVHDIYLNQIQPSVSNLQKALRGRNIRIWVTNLSSFIFAESINSLVLSTPMNLLTYAGCEIAVNSINYLLDRKEALRSNPYSFVLSAQTKV